MPKTNCKNRQARIALSHSKRSLLLGASLCLAVFGPINVVASQQAASAQASATQASQPTNAYECTQVAIEDIDPNLLTKEERIALLDGSLQDSIDQYSTCVSTVQQNMSGGGAAGGGGGEGSQGDDEGKMASEGDSDSPQAQEMDEENTAANSEVTEPMPPAKSISPAQRGVIPPKDNDKIICKLLFNEIKSINDPDMLKGLKEQYETYKCG